MNTSFHRGDVPSEQAQTRENPLASQLLGAEVRQHIDDTKLGTSTVREIDNAVFGAHKKSAAESEALAKDNKIPQANNVTNLDDATQQDKQFKPQDALAASAMANDQSEKFNQIFNNPGDTSKNN